MTVTDYYKVLGITSEASTEELKKAYRKKAREFHPDVNPSSEANDIFITITEAYEFLLTYHKKLISDEEAYNQAINDWRKYHQERSRQKARVYAKASYVKFKNTKFYRTTRIFDFTAIIYCLIISIIVLVNAVFGYIYRLHHPLQGVPGPKISGLFLFLFLGMILFVVSFLYLKAYFETSKKHKK